jgi:DNA-binding NtrC family response regulator
MAERLGERGFEVVEADSGEKAIQLLEQFAFDVVITDLRMPGADGMEVLRTASLKHPHVPVIMITAYGSVGQAVEAIKAGAFAYIEMPFEQASIKVIVVKSIGQATANTLAPQQTLYAETGNLKVVEDKIAAAVDSDGEDITPTPVEPAASTSTG